MAGPRLTGPAAKLVRSISTTTAASVPKSNTLLTSSKTSAPISRKYAELLKERNIDPDVSLAQPIPRIRYRRELGSMY